MSKFWKVLIVLLGLILVIGGGLYFWRTPGDEDLTAKVKASLNRPEFSGVSVSSEGQKGTLSGSVASQALKEEAERLAKEHWGDRTIDNRIEVASVSSPQASAEKMQTEGVRESAEQKSAEQKLEEFFKTTVVQFDEASAKLTEPSKDVLDEAAQMLARFPEKKVEIQGYTDDRGQAEVNMELSDARARAVHKYLMEKGVSGERLVAKGYGETQPVGDNNTAEGRQQNRRVAFQLQ